MAAEVDYIVQAELTRAAFEKGPDAVVIVDSAGTILMVNEQAELLTGLPRKDLLGQKAEVLVPADLREGHKDHRASYMRNPYRRLMGPDLDLTIVQRGEDGELAVPVEINLAPVPISMGTAVVLTIRQRGAQWDKTRPWHSPS
jgi:PAS domain S-box-containing protein